VGRIALTQSKLQRREVIGCEATTCRISNPAVVGIGAVEACRCRISWLDASTLCTDFRTSLPSDIVVVQRVNDLHKGSQVELNQVVLFNTILQVVDAAAHIVGHVSGQSHRGCAMNDVATEVAVVYQAIFHEDILADNIPHQVHVEWVPAHDILLAHVDCSDATDAALRPSDALGVPTIVVGIAASIATDGDGPC